MGIIVAVGSLHLPDWAVAAGVIRNVVWDHLHEYTQRTPVADVDVPYFDRTDLAPEGEEVAELELSRLVPEVHWDIKNQAAVHLWYPRRFGLRVPPFTSLEDAIAHNPETCVCVGARLHQGEGLDVIAPLGLEDLFDMVLRLNPRRATPDLFRKRLEEKRITIRWPLVRVVEIDCQG